MKSNKHIIIRIRMLVYECLMGRTFLIRLADSSTLLASLLSSVFVTLCSVFSSTVLVQQPAHFTCALYVECSVNRKR
jgi:hypothetical protein